MTRRNEEVTVLRRRQIRKQEAKQRKTNNKACLSLWYPYLLHPRLKGLRQSQVITLSKKIQAKSSEESSSDNNSSDKNEESSNDSNSTKGALLVTMAVNLTAGVDQHLDTQLDHVLQEYLLAKGGNQEVRQMFRDCNIYQFEDFVGYEVENLKDLRRKQHNTTKGFTKRKVTLIYNVIRYYNYLQSTNIVLVEDQKIG